MNRNDRWEIERSHAQTLRALDRLEEMWNDYRQRSFRQTEDLIAYVSSFYQGRPFDLSDELRSQFQQNMEEYDQFIRKKEFEIEQEREEERRNFKRKLGE